MDERLRFTACSVVIEKPDGRLDRQVRRLNDDGPRFFVDALRALDLLAPREDGSRAVLGRYTAPVSLTPDAGHVT